MAEREKANANGGLDKQGSELDLMQGHPMFDPSQEQKDNSVNPKKPTVDELP